MKASLVFCSLLVLPIGAAFAADSPWVGTWKADPAQSHVTGDTFEYSKGPGNLLHYSDGSTASYDFGIDGKEYKTWANRSATWTPTGKSSWDTESKIDGKVVSKGHRELSSDGKTLTINYSGTRPDGAPFNDRDVYTRVGGNDGLIGTWRSVKSSFTGPMEFINSSPTPGVLRQEIPDLKAFTEGPFDGKDHPVTGPTVPPGTTIAQTAVTPTQVSYVIKVGGKPDSIGTQAIATDGRSFTDTSWNPGKESEKITVVYVKQ
ncbi:MAG TPA: hypothetical protein VGI65_16980 [Steroidobacteraceae bacterium]